MKFLLFPLLFVSSCCFSIEYKNPKLSFNSEQLDEGIPGIWEIWHHFNKSVAEEKQLLIADQDDIEKTAYHKGRIDALTESMYVLMCTYPFVFYP